MKKTLISIIALGSLLVAGMQAGAQTTDEILSRMEQQLDRADAEGLAMDLILNIPVVGEIRSHNLVLGDKARVEVSKEGKTSINYSDTALGLTWTYDPAANEVTIENKKSSSEDSGSDGKIMRGVRDGYNVILKEETADAWIFVCKKSKSNKEKNDPKKMDLAVSKATYLPLYIRAKKSVFKMSFENVAIGVNEDQVTFRESDYPGVKVVDKR